VATSADAPTGFGGPSSGDIQDMRIRRPLAALFTALTLFGGGATLTACDAAGQDQNDGTTDDTGEQDSGEVTDNNDGGDTEGDEDQSNPEPGQNEDDDTQDPD
jgi:hypothetical protein